MVEDKYYDYGYTYHASNIKKIGYLLNFNIDSSIDGVYFDLLFVNNTEKFYTTKRFFPSFLIKGKNCEQVAEILLKNYSGKIQNTAKVTRINPKTPNHLRLPPETFLEVFFYNDSDYKKVLYEIKKIMKITKQKDAVQIERTNEDTYRVIRSRKNDEIFHLTNTTNVENIHSLDELILSVEEYDLPFEILFLSKENLRCGKFYEVSFVNEKYIIAEMDIVTTPPLKILAFDIETTKQPLKFPCAETDQIMMISFMINGVGFLINNKEFIYEDVQDFEYKIGNKDSDQETVNFYVLNCKNENAVLTKFFEIVQKEKPDILTTYNGDFFDIPFIETRLKMHNIHNILENILHLDCFKWVKRDSYLPMGSQGLKAVTKAKLGYFPDEVDPELMMWCGKHEPKKLCVYSVSDAVATYNLYMKYVNPFIFSLCTLIPLSSYNVLSKGSGTLCESLLIAEALQKSILIPPKRIPDEVYFEGKFCDDTTYIGGHVECLQSGIYRSDFDYTFKLKQERLEEIIELIPEIIDKFKTESNFLEIKKKIEDDMLGLCGSHASKDLERQEDNVYDFVTERDNEKFITNDTLQLQKKLVVKPKLLHKSKAAFVSTTTKPLIYHLDVAAMYPNIILTNRLQPISVIGKETCIRCDFYKKDNKCQRNMKWKMRVEYFMPKKPEIEAIKKLLSKKPDFLNASDESKEKMFKAHLSDYSRDIYKKARETKICKMENIVCQRENPFYVDVVRKFRDKRYELKNIQKKVIIDLKRCKEEEKQELIKKITVYESLQVAHKCVLNSFYGYVMRKNSRWYSMEMAAIVCDTGSSIIKLAKELVDDIGIPLELDTDGIWCMLPKSFPDTYTFPSGKKLFFVCELLNLLVKKQFTNHQYHEIQEPTCSENDSHQVEDICTIMPKNEIIFEIDGPYKAMILPASTEEGKLIKKKYLVINNGGNISELKGFELKRRGELKIIKKFQEELFTHFLEGNTLKECYEILKEVCMYYLNLIKSEGKHLSDNDIFELFSESKNMSKEYEEYEGRKTTSTVTANKLSELLGKNILSEKGLKCQYIISKYPTNAPTTERTIPIAVFQTEECIKKKFIKKWSKKEVYNLKEIIDWEYYKERLVNVMLKIIILPGILQGLGNLISEIEPPKWARVNKNKSLFDFNIETISKKKDVEIENSNVSKFTEYNDTKENPDGNKKINEGTNSHVGSEIFIPQSNANITSLAFNEYERYTKAKKSEWKSLFLEISKTYILEIQESSKTYLQSRRIRKIETKQNREIYFTLQKNITLDQLLESLPRSLSPQFIDKIKPLNDGYAIKLDWDTIFVDDLEQLISSLYIKNSFEATQNDKILEEMQNIPQLEDGLKKQISVYCILSFDFNGHKYFLCKNKSEICIISDDKNTNVDKNNEHGITYIVGNVFAFISGIKETNAIFFITKNDLYLKAFFERSEISYACIEHKTKGGLSNFKAIVSNYIEQLVCFSEKASLRVQESVAFNIPLLNFCKFSAYQFLDYLYSKELKTQNIPINNKRSQVFDYLDDFYIQKGYYGNFCVSIEIKNSMMNAIMNDDCLHSYESNKVQSNTSKTYKNTPAIIENDFIPEKIKILRKIIKNLKNKRCNSKSFTAIVLDSFDAWISNKLTDLELKNYLIYTKKVYLSIVMNKMVNLGSKIIHFNNNFVVIETIKTTKKACVDYMNFVLENMKYKDIQILNYFVKMAIVDVFNFYYLIENENVAETDNKILNVIDGNCLNYTEDQVFTSSEKSVPSDFLCLFFDNKLTNSYFYDLLLHKKLRNREMIFDMLNLYETQANVDKLKASCYTVLKINEFAIEPTTIYKLKLWCKNCSFYGGLFIDNNNISVCYKCLEPHAAVDLDDLFCSEVILELGKNEFECDNCKDLKFNRVANNCACGKHYKRKFDVKKLRLIAKHIQNTDKKEMVQEIVTEKLQSHNDF